MASRSGLIVFVVNVVNRGCHPSGCFGGMGGVVRVFLRVGAFLVLYMSTMFFPLGVVSTVVSDTHVGCQVTLNKGWGVFIVRVFSGEMFGGEPFPSVVAELFGSEVLWSPFVDVVYCAVG